MPETKFKIGDVVILKSGSPTMTVHGVGDYTMKGLNPGVLCVWFHGKDRKEDVFHPDALKLYEAEEGSVTFQPSRGF